MEKRVNVEDWSFVLQGLLEDSQIDLSKVMSSKNFDISQLPKKVRNYDSSLSLLMEEIEAVLKSDRKIRIKAMPDKGWTEYEVETSMGVTNYDMWRFDEEGVRLRSIRSIAVAPNESDATTGIGKCLGIVDQTLGD